MIRHRLLLFVIYPALVLLMVGSGSMALAQRDPERPTNPIVRKYKRSTANTVVDISGVRGTFDLFWKLKKVWTPAKAAARKDRAFSGDANYFPST